MGDHARWMTPFGPLINASPPDEPPGPPLTKGKNQRIMTPKKPSAEEPQDRIRPQRAVVKIPGHEEFNTIVKDGPLK